jgi:HD superfamily phosphodiesterase
MARDTDLNLDVFKVAGYIHDIGRKCDKDKHHILSMDFLEMFFQNNQRYANLRSDVADCILNHRSEGKPATVYGIIFQAADKAALRKRKWLDFKAQR